MFTSILSSSLGFSSKTSWLRACDTFEVLSGGSGFPSSIGRRPGIERAALSDLVGFVGPWKQRTRIRQCSSDKKKEK